MPSERVQRQIDRFLDEAEAAMTVSDWETARDRALNALALDADNTDAQTYLTGAETRLNAPGQPAAASVAQAPPPAVAQPTSFANGRYTVTKFLGEGGKKKVYLARDSLLDRDVAFALIKTEGLDEASRVRVQREAQTMGRLGAHPHIVTVFDIGEENGQPYLVLPVLAGGDVEGVIEKAPENKLTIERAVKIALDTCLGLEFAHSKGIVHRDLKPGNVWLTEDGRAMIGDFGLAVAVDKSRLTQAGMMVGTVSYMPPEQAMGGEVGPRSDLYSLGAMLYEMVCGRPPFVGDESVAIIGQHLNTPPVAPSWHRPDCPTSLEALILRLLEKDPSKRPASATEVREALESVGSAPAARDPSLASEAPSAGDNPLYRRTFVGREPELKQVQSAFDAALSGQGGLVMVIGEPGIGKTALCEQLATYVALRGGRALVGHCYEEGSLSLPYLAFVEAMRSYVLAREPDGLRSDLGTGAADVARIVSEVRDRVQDVELRPTGDPEDDRWRLLQAITSFLRNASTVQPLCIVLEDLHWADRGTLDLLLHASRNLQGARLLIVGTYRDVEVDRSHPLSSALAELGRAATFQRIRLRGLTPDEVHRMMAAVAQREIPWPLAELLHRQTEGSPLFVQEMLRYLVEEGLVAEREGSLRRVGDDTLVGRIPEGLRDVIGKRLTRLGPNANRLLATASVIGRDFRLDILQPVAGMSEDDVISALEEAKSAAVVEERASAGAVVTYRFSHAFFSQTLYEEISAPRRIRLHQQVGRAIEEVFARRLDEHAPELAEHFSHSSDGGDLGKAVRYGELAAQRAMSVFDYGEAARLLERAIEVQEVLGPDDSAKMCDLLLAFGRALMPAGDTPRIADDVAERALFAAGSIADRKRSSAACRLALEALRRRATWVARASSAYQGWVKRADQYADEDTEDRIAADIEMSGILFSQRRRTDGLLLFRRALALARKLGNEDMLARAVVNGMESRTVEYWKERTSLAEEFGSRDWMGVNNTTLGTFFTLLAFVYWDEGHLEAANSVIDRVSVLAERTRDPLFSLTRLNLEMRRSFYEGRLEEVLTSYEHFVAAAEEVGMGPSAEARGRQVYRFALLHLGHYEEALKSPGGEDANGVEAFTENSGVPLCLAYMGRTQEAEKLLKDFLNEATSSSQSELLADQLIVGLATALICGNRHAVAELSKQVLPIAHLCSAMGALVCPSRLLGNASALLGSRESARAHYEQALEISSKIGFRIEIALTHLDLAELLLEHYPDERDAAIEHLDFAIAELRDMKMQPALERALRHRGLLKA